MQSKNRKIRLFISAFISGLIIIPTLTHAAGTHQHNHEKPKEAAIEERTHEHHNHGELLSAVGSPSDSSQVDRTLTVRMKDSMRYDIDGDLSFSENEVVRFNVINEGKIPHEFSIGDAKEQKAHAQMMRNMPDMVHEDGNTLSLASGERGELIWMFQGDEEIVFACNIPGHYEAGMFAKGQIQASHH